MLTQWNRQELALAIKASLEYTIANLEDVDDETHKMVEPFSGMTLSHDSFHSNVIYMRLDDGSSYRITLIQTNPPMPPPVHDRGEREMAGTAGGEAGSGRRRRNRGDKEGEGKPSATGGE